MNKPESLRQDIIDQIKDLCGKLNQYSSDSPSLDNNEKFDPENPFVKLLEQLPVMVMALGHDNNIILWNEQSNKVTGYSREEMINNSKAIDIMFPDNMYRNNLINSWLDSNETEPWDLHVTCRDGSTKVISWTDLRRMSLVPGVKKIAIGTDITGFQVAQTKELITENKYRELFESIKNAIVILETKNNGKDFLLKDLNQSAERIDDLKKDDVIGKNILEVFPGARDFGIMEVFQRVWRTGHPELHPKKLYKDGKREVWRESYVYKMNDGTLVSIYEDQSAQMRQGEKADQNKRLYDLLSNHSTDVIWALTMGFEFKYVSPSVFKVLEYVPEDLEGRSLSKIVDPDFMRKAQRILEEDLFRINMKEYEPRRLELLLKKKNNEYVWGEITSKIILDEKDRPIEIIGTMHDISDRKRAQHEIEEREREYHDIFEAAIDAFMIFDPSGRIKAANEAACSLHGYKIEELLEKPGKIIVHPDDHDKFDKFLKQASEGKPFRTEAFDIRKDRKKIKIEVRGKQFIYRGKPHCLAVIRDISTIKKIERAQRMANLGELASNVAHEVNNPLQVVMGRAELLLMSDPEKDELRSSLNIIREQCSRARDIIKQMQIVAKPEIVDYKVVDINEVVESVVKLLEHQLSLNSIEISRKYYKDPILARVDSKKIHQCLLNLLRNASAAIERKGKITVITDLQDKQARVEIRDTGPGIEEENFKKIMDPFFTTKAQASGLGLSICYSILKAHNGELKISNNPGGPGVTASMIFPADNR